MKRITVIVPLLSMLGFACQKEPFWKKDKDPCALDFSMGDCGTAEWIQQGAHYERPCFNPNNGDELVFLESDSPDAGIVKYNIRTGEKTTILSGVHAAFTPEWGKEGWITFSSNGNTVKMKEDGSQLTQLTDWGYAEWPIFNPDGDRIMYARRFDYENSPDITTEELYKNSRIVTIDLSGNPVDSFCRFFNETICYPWKASAWSINDQIAAEYQPNGTDYGIAVYNEHGELDRVVATLDKHVSVRDIDWHPNGRDIYFVDEEGIKRIDTELNTVDLIRLTCGNERYGPLAISPDGKFLVAEYYIAIMQECANTFKYGLSLMTVDGLNEETLPLP